MNIIDGYTTDSEIKEYNLVVLKDNKKVFLPYQGAPLINEEILEKHPKIKEALEKLKNKITNSQMQKMNYEVNIEEKSPQYVAKEYLEANKII